MRLFRILFLMVALAIPLSAQQQPPEQKTYTVPESMLTAQQKAALEQQNLKGWAGIGHEIGTAVNESLKAVTDNTSQFAKTDVGKLTVAIVVWKVIGDQAIHLFVGIMFPLVWLPLWVWSYRSKCIPRRVLSRVLPDKTKEYKTINDNGGYDDVSPAAIVHTVAVALLIATTLLIIFSFR